jgi:hypothetical protein
LAGGGVSALVGGAVFKTVERQSLSLVGSIPIRLRHLSGCSAEVFPPCQHFAAVEVMAI